LGSPANAEDDWNKAIEYLNRQIFLVTRWRIGKAFMLLFIKLEKRLIEPITHWTDRADIFKLIERFGAIAANIALLVAAITYLTYGERRQRDLDVAQAWTVITTAHGQPGNGGRIEALELINASPNSPASKRFPWFWLKWEPRSLSGLEAPNAYLRGVQLPRADLIGSNLESADLWNSNLQGAHLQGANLQDAYLQEANLQGTYLDRANLQEADLREANLQEADFGIVMLENAYLRRANLQNAKFDWGSDLHKADLIYTNLQGAYLENTFLREARFARSNMQGAVLRGADLRGAVLYEANLQDVDFENASLEGAELGRANLRGAINLKVEQVISTCYWEEAEFDPTFKAKLNGATQFRRVDCDKRGPSLLMLERTQRTSR
jgi:uncharacterized protein YjbI with pentapeptide repeats